MARPRCQLADIPAKLGSVWTVLEFCTLHKVGIFWQAAQPGTGSGPKVLGAKRPGPSAAQMKKASFNLQPFSGQQSKSVAESHFCLSPDFMTYFHSIPDARVKKARKESYPRSASSR